MPDWLMKRRAGRDHARGATSRVVTARSVRASVALGLLVPNLTGCYHYAAVDPSAMPNGTEVSVGVTDTGRAALSGLVGPRVERISGRVLESTDSALVLSVTSVRYQETAESQTWAGERLAVPRGFVADIRQRHFSRARSAIFVGLLVAVAVAASRIAIDAFGGEGGDKPGPSPEPT